MKSPRPRRANLATIVGSGLAVVAAGSLIAFSSLAEQAGLEGLAARGLQPANPGRTGGGAQAITIPAPATAPPRDPRDALAELVRTSTGPTGAAEPEERPAQLFRPPAAGGGERGRPGPARPERVERGTRVAIAPSDVAEDAEDADASEWDGPPYGHAYGRYDEKPRAPKRRSKAPKRRSQPRSEDAPVYARTAHEGDDAKAPKQPKMKKVEKAKDTPRGHAKAKGHSRQGDPTGHGKAKHDKHGKGAGHSKHKPGHGKGKGKGHSKHGG